MSSESPHLRLGIVLPAAGAASRMRGREKLLEPINGTSLITRQTRSAVALGLPVLVTVPDNRPIRKLLAELQGAETTIVQAAAEGLSASLRAAADWAGAHELDGLMIVLPDLPDLDTEDLQKMLNAFQQDPRRFWRGQDCDGRDGHPVVIPARAFSVMYALRGDRGARELMENEDVGRIDLPEHHATRDIDTPEDWSRWIEKQRPSSLWANE